MINDLLNNLLDATSFCVSVIEVIFLTEILIKSFPQLAALFK